YLDRADRRPCGAVGQAITDRVFRVPAQHVAAAKADAGGAAYVYDFRWASPAGPLAGLGFPRLDVPFVFDTLTGQGGREGSRQEPPASLAADMHGAWVRFVTDGDPGWEGYETSSRQLMVFAEPSEVHEDPLRWERTAWASPARLTPPSRKEGTR